MKENAERKRKEREAKEKAEYETVERANGCDEAKKKEKVEIPRVNFEPRERERTEDEEILREKANAVQRAAAEASRWQGRNKMLQGGWQWRL